MASKASQAGWVVQVAAPLVRYINIADADKAVAATRQMAGVTTETRIETVEALSAAEIAALHLKTGTAKPA